MKIKNILSFQYNSFDFFCPFVGKLMLLLIISDMLADIF